MNIHIPAWLAAPAVLMALASLLNVFFWYHNPDDWAAFVERSPRLALLVRLSRAWGIDWRKLLRLVREGTRPFRARGLPLPEAADVVVTVATTTTTATATVVVPAPAAPPAPIESSPGESNR